MTPSTKGILKGIPGVPEADDVNITRQNIEDNFAAFNFSSANDISLYEKLLSEGFAVISNALSQVEQIFVDTKFEFGLDESNELILIDEVLTPDSSRFWPVESYKLGSSPPSFDKQYIRDYLETLDWDKKAPGPKLPEEVINNTAAKYEEARDKLIS